MFITIKQTNKIFCMLSPILLVENFSTVEYESLYLCALGDNVTLSEQDLHNLTKIMRPATPQWRTIGGSLGFPDSDLEIIQHSPSLFPEGPPGYFREMLSQWLKWAPPKHPWPTLKALSVALQSSGHECLAFNLALFYVQRKGM